MKIIKQSTYETCLPCCLLMITGNTKKDDDFIEIVDPGDGKIKKIPVEIIKRGISSLRDHLKYSPVLITIPEK